jgi:tetratricopeptide (TPR) repeat protein
MRRFKVILGGACITAIAAGAGVYLALAPGHDAEPAQAEAHAADQHTHESPPDTVTSIDAGHDHATAVEEHAALPETDSHHADTHAGEAADHAATEAAPSTLTVTDSSPLQPSPVNAGPERSPIELAEELMRDGAYSAAKIRLEHVVATAEPAVAMRAKLLWGGCAELSADLAGAKSAYDEVAAGSEELHRAAVLGRARILLRTGDAAGAADLLNHELLELNQVDVVGDVLHLLGQSLAEQLRVAAGRVDPLQDDALFFVAPTLNVEQLIARSRTDESAPPTFVPDTAFEVAPGDSPEQWIVTLRGDRLSVRGLVGQLAERSGHAVQWDDAALPRVEGRTLRVDVAGVDLAVVVDAVLAASGLAVRASGPTWSVVSQTQLTEDEFRQMLRERTRRMLAVAQSQAPDHSWLALTHLRVAQLAAADGQLKAALDLHRQAEAALTDRGVVETLLNEGKLQLRLGERGSAIKTLYRCVDAGEMHPLRPTAYLYLGRIQLETNAPAEAISPLQRALQLTRDTDREPLTRVLLASALILKGDLPGASSILSTNRAAIAASDMRDAAAFLDAYARYKGEQNELQRVRGATHLIDSLVRLDPTKLFGDHWWSLATGSFRAVGLTPEADRLEQAAVQHLAPSSLKEQMTLRLLEDRLNLVAASQLPQVVSSYQSQPRTAADRTVWLAIAETEFRRGLHDAAITHCREFLQQPALTDDDRRMGLRLLGRIHQARGEHKEALQCFVGVLPGTVPAAPHLDSLLQTSAKGGH